MGHSRSQGSAGPCGLRGSLPYTLLGKGFGHPTEVFACQSPSTVLQHHGPWEGDKGL